MNKIENGGSINFIMACSKNRLTHYTDLSCSSIFFTIAIAFCGGGTYNIHQLVTR